MFVIYDGFFHATYAFHKNAVNVESFLYIENWICNKMGSTASFS